MFRIKYIYRSLVRSKLKFKIEHVLLSLVRSKLRFKIEHIFLRMFRSKHLLSSSIKKQFKPYAKELKTKIHVGNVLSKTPSVVCAFFLPFAICLLFWTICKIPFLNNYLSGLATIEKGVLSSTVNANAAVVAGFTGVLVAIIAFGINVNTLFTGLEDHLFQKLIKRGGYLFIAALAVGSVLFSLIMGMIGNLMSPEMFYMATILALLIGAAVLVSEILLLAFTLRHISQKACREFLAENFREDHKKALCLEIRRRIGVNIFVQNLVEMGFTWNIFIREPRVGQVGYRLPECFVNDVYFPRLEKIAKHLELEATSNNSEDFVALLTKQVEKERPTVAVLPFSGENKYAIITEGEAENYVKLQVSKSFICSNVPALTIPEVDWVDIGKMLNTQVRSSNDSGLKEVLKVIEAIIEDYLTSLNSVGIDHSRRDLLDGVFTNYRPPELNNFQFKELLVLASEKKSNNCVDVLCNFFSIIGRTAFDRKCRNYYEDVIWWVRHMYFYCGTQKELLDNVRMQIVDSFNFLGPLTFNSFLHDKKNSLEAFSETIPYSEHFLNVLASTLNDAALAGDEETFRRLLEVVDSLNGDTYSSARAEYDNATSHTKRAPDNDDYKHKTELSEAKLKIYSLVNLTRMLVAAWIAELHRASKLDSEVSNRLARFALTPIMNSTDLFEIYLLAKGSRRGCAISFDWWDHIDHLAGRPYSTGCAFENWVEPFWLTYVLSLAGNQELQPKKIKKIRLLTSFRTYDYQAIVKKIDKLIENETFYNWFVEKETLKKGQDTVTAMFFEIKKRQEDYDVKNLLAAALSEKKVEAFKNDCTQGYKGRNTLLNLCLEFGINRTGKATNWTKQTKMSIVREKECFIDDWHVGFGNQQVFGARLAEKEQFRFSNFIKDNLKQLSSLTNLNHVSSNLKAAAHELRGSNKNPNLVLIPQDSRFQRLFTDKPQWQRDSAFMKDELPMWVASFENMEVFIWDQPCIAILDTMSFLEFNTRGELEISIQKVAKQDIEKWLSSEKSPVDKELLEKELQKCEGSYDKVAEFHRIVELRSNNYLGIADASAGFKFAIEAETIGVVCDKSRRLCHAIDCEIAKTISSDEREYFPTAALARAHNYSMCDECDPLFGDML